MGLRDRVRRLEAGMDTGELRESRAEDAALGEQLEGLTLDEKIAAVDRQIEELESLIARNEEQAERQRDRPQGDRP